MLLHYIYYPFSEPFRSRYNTRKYRHNYDNHPYIIVLLLFITYMIYVKRMSSIHTWDEPSRLILFLSVYSCLFCYLSCNWYIVTKMLQILFIAVALLLVTFLLYYISVSKYEYWKKRGVLGPKPVPLLGNIGDAILMKKQLGEIYTDIYK